MIRNDAIAFLKRNFIAQIAVSNQNKPAASVVVYVIDEDLAFYFIVRKDSYKARCLASNPQISLVVWKMNEMSVQADGMAFVVEDEAKKEWVMNAFADTVTNDPNFIAPLIRMAGDDRVIFKVVPRWMRALDLSVGTLAPKESPFTEISV